MSSGSRHLGDFAHDAALEIFDLSKTCLMAHSVRAVEEYIERSGRPYSIRIKIKSEFAAKAQANALAYIFPHKALIIVNEGLGKELKRRAIAHELGHVVVAFEELKNNVKLNQRVSKMAESACGVFETDLCARHHGFNKKEENRSDSLFHTLSEHPLAQL